MKCSYILVCHSEALFGFSECQVHADPERRFLARVSELEAMLREAIPYMVGMAEDGPEGLPELVKLVERCCELLGVDPDWINGVAP